jgi:cold shock CspA family protein
MTSECFGRIKALRPDGYYGFIAGDDGRDHFFHASGLAVRGGFAALQVGDRVGFRLTPDPRGARAEGVTRL